MQIIFNQYTNACHVVRSYYRNTLPCSCRLISAVMPGPSPLFFTINIGLSSASSKLFTRCPLLLAVIVSLTCHTNIITIMQLPVASLCTLITQTYLHEFLHNIPAKDMIKYCLKELICDYG